VQQLQKNSGHNAFCLKQYGLACYLSAHQIATRQPSAKHHLPKGTLCGLYKANFGTPIVKTQNKQLAIATKSHCMNLAQFRRYILSGK